MDQLVMKEIQNLLQNQSLETVINYYILGGNNKEMGTFEEEMSQEIRQ